MENEFYSGLRLELNRGNGRPLYRQLAEALEGWIRNGTLSPGDKLPGNVDMSKILGLGDETVRRAFGILVDKNLIERTRRAGSFVREDVTQPHPTIGFFYFIEDKESMARCAEYMQRYLGSLPCPYDIKLICFDKDYYAKTDLLQEIRQKRLDGAVIVPLPGEECMRQLERLEDAGFPYIRFANPDGLGRLSAPLVWGNERQRTRTAFECLWNRGHRKIGLIAKHSEWGVAEEFRKIYEEKKGSGQDTFWISTSGGGPMNGAAGPGRRSRGDISTKIRM